MLPHCKHKQNKILFLQSRARIHVQQDLTATNSFIEPQFKAKCLSSNEQQPPKPNYIKANIVHTTQTCRLKLQNIVYIHFKQNSLSSYSRKLNYITRTYIQTFVQQLSSTKEGNFSIFLQTFQTTMSFLPPYFEFTDLHKMRMRRQIFRKKNRDRKKRR